MKILRSIPGLALLLWNTFVSSETAIAVASGRTTFLPKVPGRELLLGENELFPRAENDEGIRQKSLFRRLPAIEKIDLDELIRDNEARLEVQRSA